MIISYSVGKEKMFNRLEIDIEPGSLTLITGYEGMETYVLSGIIARLFPIEIDEFVEPLNEILKYFNGSVTVHSGWFPEKAVYVGRDPEKHLLFSRVYEEIEMRSAEVEVVLDVMKELGMGKNFLSRRITTLSGGEMMKVAISLALVKKSDLYVFHGIFGWLDDTVRNRLLEIFKKKIEDGVCVVIIDEEYSQILELAKKSYYFDGRNLDPDGYREIEKYRTKISEVIDGINEYQKRSRADNAKKLVFKNVSFSYSSIEKVKDAFSLNNISFSIDNNRIYALIGKNGSGKSTIAGLICRVLRPDSGEILFNGRPLQNYIREELLKKICYVGQFPEHQLIYSNTYEYKKAARKLKNEFSLELLKREFKKNIPISLLSPYQMKLLLLLSNIWVTTELIILDEPTWGIGISEKVMFYTVLKELVSRLENISILIITHSNELLENLDCTIMVIEDGTLR